MQAKDWRQTRVWTRDEMLKRVARFRDLKGSDGGLPDSKVPECRRTLFAVIGFQPQAEFTPDAMRICEAWPAKSPGGGA